ncbi:MAG TPA: DotU family type IV/VI secretion system protein [Polyangiaceae bacterium]
MTDSIYWSSADVLVLAAELPSAHLPSPAELRQRLLGVLERMVTSGRAAGVAEADLAEARYAFVAFIDEQILKSSWAGRTEWMSQPLQLLLYRENTAGENFFVRMRALLHDGRRPAALEAYYLCLALGFRGAYERAGDIGPIATFLESAREQLGKRLPTASTLSPNARLPDRAPAEKFSKSPLLLLLAGSVAVTVIVLVALSLSMRSAVKDVTSAAALVAG